MTRSDEIFLVSTNMINHGGSFIKMLGHLIVRADNDNIDKIKETWPKYWFEYLNFKD